jgi:beta-lactamase class D
VIHTPLRIGGLLNVLRRDLASFAGASGDGAKANVNLKPGGLRQNLLKQIAMLALATIWSWGATLGFAAAPGTSPNAGNDPSTTSTSSSASSSEPPVRKSTAVHRTRRTRRAPDPWGLSSYGNPAAEDNPAGEDPVVRQAALDAIGKWNGSIVVVDPNSGRILSMVNQKLALSSGFTPCSTIKPMVALAALREGLITPSTKLYVGTKTRIDLTDALAHSNNVFFHRLGEMLGFKRITEYAQEFGLGEKAGLDIPGESAGLYPSAPPKEGGVGFLAYCGTSIEVTALQMAAILSAIANGGTLYALQYPRTAEELISFQPVVRRRLEDLAKYFPQIRDGLAGSVLYGTGHSAYDPDLSIYGKTGTCSENGARLGWFASFAGGEQAKYVVVVLLRGGRMMYGPHAAEIAGHVYRELEQKERTSQVSRALSFTLDSK